MLEQLWYVYGVVPATLDTRGAPEGVEGGAITLVPQGDVAALVSHVPAEGYDAATLEARMADLTWLGIRARAHDEVLTWASDRGAVIPLPIFSLFNAESRVRDVLRERAVPLAAALDRVSSAHEYMLRVYREDAKLAAAMGELSARIAELERTAAAAPPGQRYLLQRKLEAERKTETRRVSEMIAAVAFESLAAHVQGSRGAVRMPMPNTGADAPGTMVLNAAFLVAHDDLDAFRAALTEHVERYEPAGMHFQFTGPWPPYHFTDAVLTDAPAVPAAGSPDV